MSVSKKDQMIVQNARRGTKCVGSFDPMSQRGQNSGTIMITIVHLAMQYGAVCVHGVESEDLSFSCLHVSCC